MSDTYSPEADALGSWLDAVTEIRDRHRQTVKTFLPALRNARLRKRLPRHLLARQIGVSTNTLSKWEWERHIPPPDLFSRWRDLLSL